MDVVEKVQLYRRFVDATVQEAMKALDKFDGDVDKALMAKGIEPVSARAVMDEEEDAEKPDPEKKTKFEYYNFVGPRAVALQESWLNELLEEQGNMGRLLCVYFMRGDWPVAIFAEEKKTK